MKDFFKCSWKVGWFIGAISMFLFATFFVIDDWDNRWGYIDDNGIDVAPMCLIYLALPIYLIVLWALLKANFEEDEDIL